MTPEQIQTLVDEFENLRQSQWDEGAKEYGPSAFANLHPSQLLQMMYEELADGANYCMMLFIRIRTMEAELASRLDSSDSSARQDPEHWIPSGGSTFMPATEVPGFLPESKRLQDT